MKELSCSQQQAYEGIPKYCQQQSIYPSSNDDKASTKEERQYGSTHPNISVSIGEEEEHGVRDMLMLASMFMFARSKNAGMKKHCAR